MLRDLGLAIRLGLCWGAFATGMISFVLGSLILPARRLVPFVRWTFRLGARLAGVRATIQGLEHLDPGKGYLLMGNHVSGLEVFIFQGLFPWHVVGVEKKENFRIPLYGAFVRRWGNIPIDRSDLDAAKRSLELAKAKLASGACVAILPEGTRSKTGELLPFKKGPFHLAIDTQAEIVCYSVRGIFEVNNTTDWRIRPGPVTVTIHAPLSCAGMEKDQLDALSGQVRAAILSGLDEPQAHAAPLIPT